LASAVCDLPQPAAATARRIVATLAEWFTDADLISRAANVRWRKQSQRFLQQAD